MKKRENGDKPFVSGLIEGFYGRQWSWGEREGWCRFLSEQEQDFYLYAPKGDDHLRKRWLEPWDRTTRDRLERLRDVCGQEGLMFGPGLSPYEIYLHWDDSARRALERRLDDLKGLEPGIFGLFFDDMEGDRSTMAQVQADVAHIAADRLPDARIVVCPTYYSYDPCLRLLFGDEPAGYLEGLGKALDPSIDVFWTGPLVCSESYPEAHLAEIAARLGRKPFIWDNYPVNDGARIAPFLFLRPPAGRPVRPEELTSGFAVNPMNQPWLSRIPFAGLAETWRSGETDPEKLWAVAVETIDDPKLRELLTRDRDAFQDRGIGHAGTQKELAEGWSRKLAENPRFPLLSDADREIVLKEQRDFDRKAADALTEEERLRLASEYERIGHPAACEVAEWLRGLYRYDPSLF